MRLMPGTLTFLFTDIEGSSQLWERFPVAMRGTLALHDALIKEVVSEHLGKLFRSTGDGYWCAFQNPQDATNAALHLQIRLQKQHWNAEFQLKVRIGIHCGEVESIQEGYAGTPINRLARLFAIAHGGQILLSQDVAQALQDTLPHDATLLDLGLHRLKDLQHPEHVFQLQHPLLQNDFLPLRSLTNALHNLPIQVSSFVGREQELKEAKQALRETRLLTLVGAGGSGKTRLLLQTAAECVNQYPQGVWLCELASLSDPRLLAQTVAFSLGLQDTGEQEIEASLLEWLREREVLLVWDNCEHLLEACGGLASRILADCPKVSLLASSREGLHLSEERRLWVPPLGLPSEGAGWEAVSACESVRLFVERARSSSLGFVLTEGNASLVGGVCRRLDGIPLAIELAASRVRALSLEQIGGRLEDRFRLLTGGNRSALPRQQTLRATVDWSYDLLSERERLLLCRLSVFQGGCSLEGALRVCSDGLLEGWEFEELLSSLCEKSLLLLEEGGVEVRYRLLETIREYGLERLERMGETTNLRDKHRAYYVSLAEPAREALMGKAHSEWQQRLRAEHDNIRTVLRGCIENPKHGEAGLLLVGSLWRFWKVTGMISEARELLDTLLALPTTQVPTIARVRALRCAGTLAGSHNDLQISEQRFEEALKVCEAIGYRRGIGDIYSELGILWQHRCDPEKALGYLQASLEIRRELGTDSEVGGVLASIALILFGKKDYAEAQNLLEQTLALTRKTGNRFGEGIAISNIACCVVAAGDMGGGKRLYQEAVEVLEPFGVNLWIADCYGMLGSIAFQEGKLEEAEVALLRGYTLAKEAGVQDIGGRIGGDLALLALTQGNMEVARGYLRDTLLPLFQAEGYVELMSVLRVVVEYMVAGEQWEVAAWVTGLEASLERTVKWESPEYQQVRRAKTIQVVVGQLGEARFAQLKEEGEGMDLEAGLQKITEILLHTKAMA